MPLSIETLISRNLREVFGERDAARRHRAIAELYLPDCIFADAHGEYRGHAELEKAVVALQARFPNFMFSETGVPQVAGAAGRLTWSFGPPGAAARSTGMDVAIVRDGRIAALYAFLDPPPSEAR